MAVVWYVGAADVRVIDTTEWTRIALPGATKQWDKTNGWSLDQTLFTAGQLTFLGGLNEFSLNGAAAGTPRPGAAAIAAVDSALTLADMLEYIDAGGSPPVTLTDAATINWDAAASSVYRVTLGGNRTLANPTWSDNVPRNGKPFRFEILQDATGTRTLAWGNKFVFGTTYPSPTLTTTASKRDIVEFAYNSTTDTFMCTNIAKGI
jgi:hypothetical protein